MLKQQLFGLLAMACMSMPAFADETDAEGRIVMYVRGGEIGSQWECLESHRMTRNGDSYSITLPHLNGEFKVSSTEWHYEYGASNQIEINDASCVKGQSGGPNFKANNLKDVTITFTMGGIDNFKESTWISISANGHQAPEPPEEPETPGLSGTLPVLYINVYGEDGNYNNEIIDRNLGHKDYFNGEYWLDLNGCQWLADLGAESVGSKEEPLPLEIKARGNYTRLAFAKKPFKLKLGSKKSLLGMSKSKHYAILAHADDNYGYLRNFTGFNLGKRIGLPWTPSQQPVEVVINGDYRGLYFLTESIRIEEDRINITELDDNVSESGLVSGGYLVELDNYDEDNQIRMPEKSCVDNQYLDMLRVTWDTPEEYSDLQKRFVTDQFSAMNDYVGANSDELWKYMDLDDAARYYLVEEIISHTESYHGSTYMFRDRGEGKKWHFSPLWDCGNAFNGSADAYLYDCDPFGNTWIPSMRENGKFNDKVKETWKWFMSSKYDGIINDIDAYVSHISAAAKADRARWAGAQRPDYEGAQDVVDNTDMKSRRDAAVNKLNGKINWLKGKFGEIPASGSVTEPARDTTEAAPLPDYAKEEVGVQDIVTEGMEADETYFNLQGIRVEAPVKGNVYIVVRGDKSFKAVY